MFDDEIETQTYRTPCKRLVKRREREARGNVELRGIFNLYLLFNRRDLDILQCLQE